MRSEQTEIDGGLRDIPMMIGRDIVSQSPGLRHRCRSPAGDRKSLIRTEPSLESASPIFRCVGSVSHGAEDAPRLIDMSSAEFLNAVEGFR